MKKITRNILIGTGLAAVSVGAAAASSYFITKKFVNIAMDREDPEFMKTSGSRLSGYIEDSELIESLDIAEEKLKNSSLETVEIQSRDGLKLIGHWHEASNPKRVMIAMHGWRSSWAKDFGMIADFWHDNDCCVLYAEQRAHGESEGEYMSFGLLERYDCLDWINWVNKKNGGSLPIYLGGISMGATTVLMAGGLELPENVRGIMSDSGFTSPHEIWKHVISKNLRIPYDAVKGIVADNLSKKKIAMTAREYSTIEAMQNCKIPVLFIHGTADHFVPINMTYDNFNACKCSKKLLVVPGADHGMSYIADREAYEDALKAMWAKYDKFD